MSSYGDPHAGEYDGYQPSSGRAQVPSNGYSQESHPDDAGYSDNDSYGSDNGSYARSGGGYYSPPASGSAPVSGRASVPAGTGRASVPGVAGRAAVPVSPAVPSSFAPPAAGRAVVRPAVDVDDDRDEYDRPKRSAAALRKKKRAQMQKWIIAGVGVFILLAGGGLIGGSYAYTTVLEPKDLKLDNNTEVFANDNTQLARLGNTNRVEVPMSVLPDQVKHALIAGEDKNFYNHKGVDMWGIARAAWNNLTGGETQGASTITQQYARQAARDTEMSYARKVREAIMARKLEDRYTKEEILGFYLNTVYFGRGAHGVGSAAQAYFGIPPDKIGDPQVGLKVEQAAVLGAVLKQPEGNGGFDPAKNIQNARGRWSYVLDNMIENKWLAPQEKAALQYPAAPEYPNLPEGQVPPQGQLQLPKDDGGASGYTDKGTGFVVNYVEKELEERGIISALQAQGYSNWKNAGLRIYTTIEPKIQTALEAQLNRANPEAQMNKDKLRDNVIGAGVAIDPKTGRVLAYYGGSNNGTQTDYAGTDQPHPPASSNKIYTLTTAILEGMSTKSHWDPTELKKKKDGFDLGNANREGDDSCNRYCTLEEMTVKSFNVPFFDITRQVTPKKVVETMYQAGVKTMWTQEPFAPHDLSQPVEKRSPFDYWVGIGQYPITVLDHASGTATIANGGVYMKPHFVWKVEQKDDNKNWVRVPQGDWQFQGQQTIPRDVAEEVTGVLKKIPTGQYALRGGRQAAGKTGTWENGAMIDADTRKFPNTSAHVWYTGYTAQVAAAIWLGSNDENATPIKYNTGKQDLLDEANIESSYPKLLWKYFMDKASEDMAFKEEALPNGSGGRRGDENAGTGKSPSPSGPECTFPFFNCRPDDRPSRRPRND